MEVPPSPLTLNREEFQQTLPLIALLVPVKLCSTYLQKFDRYLYKRPRMKRVYDVPDYYASQIVTNSPPPTQIKAILLSDKIQTISFEESAPEPTESLIPRELLDFHRLNCQQHGIPPPYYLQYPFQLTYEDFSAEDVLHKLLSSVVSEVPTSFETIGHIAHLNLREEVLPYRFLIGQVLLDKNPILKLVVNKIGNIETQFRTFPLEVIARRESNPTDSNPTRSNSSNSNNKEEFVVEVRESQALFRFNFAEVYWNSRLQYEHQRIIEKLRHRSLQLLTTSSNTATTSTITPLIVADMMAGVGPFAVPLAMTTFNETEIDQARATTTTSSNSERNNSTSHKKNNKKVQKIHPISVYANDLNPVSYRYLVENQQINKCQSQLIPFNLDGREFMRKLVLEQHIYPSEVIMNLPAIATDFLDVFIGLYAHFVSEAEEVKLTLPRIHVYAFSTDSVDPIQDIVQRVAGVLHCNMDLIRDSDGFEGHIVRDVAPKKVMVCLSFTLPYEVATRTTPSQVESNVEAISKKRAREEESNTSI